MTTDDDNNSSSVRSREPVTDEELQERVVDYLTALGEALRIPPYGTEAGEPIYYRLLADRLEVAVHTLEVTLGNGLDRALPDQTAALRARVAELSTDVYRHAGENWGFHPARPQVQTTGDQLRSLVTDFLTALLDMLDTQGADDRPPHPWLLEDRVVAADIALTEVLAGNLDQSLTKEADHLRDQLAEFRTGTYPG